MIVTLLALSVMLVALTACTEDLAPGVTNPGPQDIVLVPYTGRDFAISGLVPQGWVEVKSGHFQRSPAQWEKAADSTDGRLWS